MKLRILATVLLLAPSLWATSLKAENPDHLRHLATTGGCTRCNLNGANLSNVSLNSANLSSSDFIGAFLDGSRLINANLTRA
ncbi:MAG TPA: pentapeptide repeat-containing protein, partial [Oculatellaceae cyanobacterium]